MISTVSLRSDIDPIEREIRSLFEAKKRQAAAYGPWIESLWAAASPKVIGGKLVRPRLFLSALDALSGPEPGTPASDTQAAARELKFAVALELLHYSFLLHDDVIDGDTLRRGAPNLIAVLADSMGDEQHLTSSHTAHARAHTRDQRMHWARSCAILMGNLLLAEVHQIFAAVELPADARTRLLALLDHTITDSVVGEQLDVGLSDGLVNAELATILQMCARKTATYTFELPLRAAAIFSGANPRLEPILAQASQILGLAFQLQDDLLSVFGDPRVHGKDALSDIREGKETALIAYARMTSYWPLIEPLFGVEALSDGDGENVRSMLMNSGAKNFVESLVEEQTRAFHDLLAKNNDVIPANLARLLSTLSEQLEGRSS